jgi:hypothetical protein
MPPQEDEKPEFEENTPPETSPEPDLDNPEFLTDTPFSADDEEILGDEASSGAPEEAGFEAVVEAEEEAKDADDDGLGAGIDLGSDLDMFAPVEESVPIPRASEPEPESLSFSESTSVTQPPSKRKRRPSNRIELDESELHRAKKEERARTSAPEAFSIPTPARPPAALRFGAFVLGILLISGALRTLVLFGTGAPPGPLVVKGAGWTAANFQTFHVRDLSGRRALVVRGRLRPDGPDGIPPVVLGTLIDGRGRSFGTGVRAQPVWLPDEVFAPDHLIGLLDGRGTSVGSGSGLMDGFTLLFPEPSAGARRIRIELQAAS